MILASGLKGHWTDLLKSVGGNENGKWIKNLSSLHQKPMVPDWKTHIVYCIKADLLPCSAVRHLKSQWKPSSLFESCCCMYKNTEELWSGMGSLSWRKCRILKRKIILNDEKKLSIMCLSENKLVAWMLGNSS